MHLPTFLKQFTVSLSRSDLASALEPEDRRENIRRVGAVAELFTQAGIITLTAFISPYRSDREAVRKMLPETDFIEVYVKAPLDCL